MSIELSRTVLPTRSHTEGAASPPAPGASNFDNHRTHLQDWALALKSWGGILPEGALGAVRRHTFERMEQLGLPVVPNVRLSLSDFLSDPQNAFAALRARTVRMIVEPQSLATGLPTFRFTRPDPKDLPDRLTATVPSDLREKYWVILKEFIPLAYQGLVFVNPDQSMWGEFSDPTSPSVALGGAADYFVSRDRFTGVFRHTAPDDTLRRRFYDAILKIPHRDTGRFRVFHPGYYELIIAQRDQGSQFVTLFDDYRDGAGFALLQETDTL